MVLNVWSLSEVELLQFLTLNLCGFDPGSKAGSRWVIPSNLVISLVPQYYILHNPESKFYFRSQGYWVNIWHNFVQERCINYSYAGKVGWWANHSLGIVKVPFIYYVSIFIGLKYANITIFLPLPHTIFRIF